MLITDRKIFKSICLKQIFDIMELLVYFDGLVQDCSNSIANALELLQSCTKPSICHAPT